MTDVEKAEQTLRDLTGRRDAHVESGAKLAAARRDIAYSPHTGDSAASKKLHDLNHKCVTHGVEMQGINEAIAEATSRLEAATRTEAMAAERANAQELVKALAEFRERGRKVSEALATFVAEANALSEALSAIHSLGCEHPSGNQFEVYARLVVMSAFSQIPWRWRREFDQISPAQRRTFEQLTAELSATVERQINAVLGATEPTKPTEPKKAAA
jgi:dGTP triphosphohydrolase